MRLTELNLERYGAFAERNVAIPSGPGLTVVYGPNEAGKSTCLCALSDFLFGIPERTPHGALFGYDQMRVGATFVDSTGSAVSLRRRRGRGRTLIDAAGAPVDDAVLGRLLGATTRDRFSTLFGLNHETLRSGGARLLAADGDIGRLIVEAGGGLRSLMGRLDDIDKEADKLFATRRSGERAFYKALDAFDAADRDVKQQTVTREAYEQSRKAEAAARGKLAGIRDEKQRVSAEISSLDRLTRALPHILELDRIGASLGDYTDLKGLAEDFGPRLLDALLGRDAALVASAKARAKRDRLVERLSALKVSEPFIAAEAEVRDLAERAIHTRKARSDWPNRQKEIDAAEAGLATLRRMLHLPAEAELASRLPDQAALDRVQRLATQAIERAAAIAAARERANDLSDRLAAFDQRLAASAAAGHDKPAGFDAGQFASLPAQGASVRASQRLAEKARSRALGSVSALGFDDPDSLAAFTCPSPEMVQEEQSSREGLESELAEQLERKVHAETRGNAAEEAIAGLQAAGPVASDEALAEARQARSAAWAPLRAAYLDAQLPADPPMRRYNVDAFETELTAADDVADRRAFEAQRAASLALARQQLAGSRSDIQACETMIGELKGRLDGRRASFALAFPDATHRHEQLSGLLAFVERRAKALEEFSAARGLADQASRQVAELEPQLSLFAKACGAMEIARAEGEDLATGVQALCATLSKRENAYLEQARDLREAEAIRPTVKRAADELAGLMAARDQWQGEWSAALAALGLDVDLAPEQAGNLVSEWSGARSTLASIALSRTRLSRMDEDEAGLQADVVALGGSLGLTLPEDPVAAAEQIRLRWEEQEGIRQRRDVLLPEVEDAKFECDEREKEEKAALEAVAALAAKSSTANDDEALRRLAARCSARASFLKDKERSERSLGDVSDGLGLRDLREQAAGRSLDELRAALLIERERSAELDSELEPAILAQKEAQDALDLYATESGVNRSLAQRESAAARMQQALERYVELTVARAIVTKAIERIRREQQDPLVKRAGELFAYTTRGEFAGIDTEVDEKGLPVVVGRRQSGAAVPVAAMSDGTRDQLFLAFRLASLENYAASTEPLPFIADDILVHFDDERSSATLDLLARFAETNQVLLFTHHRSVRDDAARLVDGDAASIVDIQRVDA